MINFIAMGILLISILIAIIIIIYKLIRRKFNAITAAICATIISVLCAFYIYNLTKSNLLIAVVASISLGIGIIAGITFAIYKLVRWKFNPYVALLCSSLIPLCVVYIVCSAIYPGDEFYKMEFETILGTEFPASGDIIRKDASYPDFTGDYCSSALIELSREDYNNLLEYVKNNEIFSDSSICISRQYNYVIRGAKGINLVYKASYGDADFKFIGFFDDGKTVIIHLVNE